MRKDRPIRPGRRKGRIDIKPSAAAASYPLSDHIVPPTDAKGKSVSLSISMPPSIARLTTIIVLKNKLPFRTPQDCYRWCVQHGLEALVKLIDDEEVHSDWAEISNFSRVAAKMKENREYEQHLQLTIREIGRLIKGKHHVKAQQLAELVWKNCDRMEDPHWRRIYRETAKAALDRMKRGLNVVVPFTNNDSKEDME